MLLLESGKMKHKISVSVDEKTIFQVRKLVRTGKFRNRSHAVEYALKRLQDEWSRNITGHWS
jgi:Arc/MetJ-type ribon-helix-helix transcriptional regulator